MTYETLAVERVDDEVVTLARRGWQYRVTTIPRGKLRVAALAVRRTFHTAEVAWRAFDFVVATERLWGAAGPSERPDLRTAAERAALAFRDAAIRHCDPPGIGGVAELVDVQASR